MGPSPATMSTTPSTLREIKQKIEREKRPTCSIAFLIAFTWQLEILVTVLIRRAGLGLVGVGRGC